MLDLLGTLYSPNVPSHQYTGRMVAVVRSGCARRGAAVRKPFPAGRACNGRTPRGQEFGTRPAIQRGSQKKPIGIGFSHCSELSQGRESQRLSRSHGHMRRRFAKATDCHIRGTGRSWRNSSGCHSEGEAVMRPPKGHFQGILRFREVHEYKSAQPVTAKRSPHYANQYFLG